MRLALIKSRVPLGSGIRVSMRIGESLEGTLLEIDDDCLVIRTRDSETLLEADSIVKVDRISSESNSISDSTGSASSSTPTGFAPPGAVVFPAAASQHLGELERRVRSTVLKIGEPDWNVYADDLDLEVKTQLNRDLTSIRNRYEHALKVRYNDRLLECVGSLRKLAEDYRAFDAVQIAGRILWHLGYLEKARDLFAEAADELNNSSTCFDLAVAQRGTDEREFAPRTLHNGISSDLAPDDPALMALTAIVLIEGGGKAELGGLVLDAAAWQPGRGRLAVLHCGLLCVARPALAGFPVDQWDDEFAEAGAFEIVARVLERYPALGSKPALTSADTAGTGQNAAPTAARSESPLAETPDLAVDVSELTATVYVSLNRRNLAAAEQALAQLRRSVPLDPRTLAAEQAVAGAKRMPNSNSPSAAKPQQRVATAEARTEVKMPSRGNVAHSTESNIGSPFHRAQDAVNRRKLEQARQLFEQAIAEGDEPLRAVRQLSTLLSYRLKQRDAALELLERHKDLFKTPTDRWDWSQHRSTVLEHAGRWEEAAAELTSMLGRASNENRIKVIRRATVALLKSFQYDEAKALLERELEADPDDPVIQVIHEQVNQAMVTGAYTAIEATLQGQAEATSELSPLLAFHLEHCQYWGVPAESLARHEFTEEDLKWVDDLVTGRTRRRVLGSNRPRERAEANLSAARIMQDMGLTDDDFRHRLRDFAAAMGDACVVDAKGNADVIRAYYSEAVSVTGDWSDTVGIKLRQLVMSFAMNDVRLLDPSNLPDLETALASVMKAKHLAGKLLATLLALPTQGEVTSRLIRRIWSDRATREIFQKALADHLKRPTLPADQRSFTKAWIAAAEQDRSRRRVYRQITTLSESGPALLALDRHSDQLQRVSREVADLASATDLARIGDCLGVVTDLREYMAQSVYVERERMFAAVRTGIRDKAKEFEDAPTVLSIGVLHPYLCALEQELKDDFQQYAANAEPANLKVEQVVNRYLPSGGVVTVQLQVSNSTDASPVSGVELEVLPSDDYINGAGAIPVAESIAAGESRTCQVSLQATRPAIEQELITLNCRVHFTLRSHRRVTAPAEAHSIRLHPDEEWVEIPNPYSAGLPVENPDMFKGRDQLIADLIELVGRQERGSVIVFGQKRAGKSSVLLHLQQKLTLPHVAIRFSIPELTASSSTSTFTEDLMYAISSQIHRKLRNLAEDEKLAADPPPAPDIAQIRLAGLLKFNEYMEQLQRWMKNAGLSGSRLVLLIDEFSVIHKEIRVHNLPADFMKGWKAILEKGYFRCVLVGNDLMPRFIDEFPNEFQVALQKRVSFLDPLYARQLIVDPIRDPSGDSRYRGNAVERIIELTGCSPYYIQLFCRELVQYMNRDDVRAPAIGPADADTVARKMITQLDQTNFDNLLTPGDAEVTDIDSGLVMDVLHATRRESGPSMYHEVNVSAHPESERVIQDLVRREVLKRLSGNRYRIQVGLFSEWLQHRWA